MYYIKKIKTITLKISEPGAEKEKVTNSGQCYNIAKEIYKNLDDDQEHLVVFFLNSQNKINGYKMLFKGTQTSAQVDMKVLFRNALQFGACSIILTHNHPSGGIVKPSEEDKNVTKAIMKAGEILEMKLLDHVILGDDNYYSFADEGLIGLYNTV